ncbi:MAG: type 1 glutamine amidotransferase [Methylococcus sp.]|nr:type 1 glutamine amidotransferase [Methylococcus sp.]
MHIHYVQHVPFEGLGYIDTWLSQQRAWVTSTRTFLSESFPTPDAFDGLIVLGGPMCVHDAGIHPWLEDEIRFIADTITARKSVLGICLGAQLIARALGSPVYPNEFKEIGWHVIQRGDSKLTPAPNIPEHALVFQWHGETFDLPEGAIRLASSQACTNQAFLYDDRVLGLQFHLEMLPAGARALIHYCSGDLTPGPYVQTPEAILAEAGYFLTTHRLMDQILRYLFLARGTT